MSNSNSDKAQPRKASQKVHLTATADSPSTEIFVIDGRFKRVAKGFGQLEQDFAPGLYKVKFKAGSLVREVHTALAPGSGGVVVQAPEMLFSTAAPILNTGTTREFHGGPAQKLSLAVRQRRGSGSSIFVFVRSLDEKFGGNVAKGLTLHDRNGALLFDFGQQAVKGAAPQGGQTWAGANIALHPGSYLLRVTIEKNLAFEQTIVASPNWQTQVFLLTAAFGRYEDIHRADLVNASIFMARPNRGFDPKQGIGRGEPNMRIAELARQGLANGRVVVTEQQLDDLLWAKYDNPMMGIYGAHLLLLAPKPNQPLLRKVVSNLRRLVGPHPDVMALESHIRAAQVAPRAPIVYDLPPMLRSSWNLVINASLSNPELVPTGSLAARVWGRLCGDGAWLVWNSIHEAVGTKATGAPVTAGKVVSPQKLDKQKLDKQKLDKQKLDKQKLDKQKLDNSPLRVDGDVEGSSAARDVFPRLVGQLRAASGTTLKKMAQQHGMSDSERIVLEYLAQVAQRRALRTPKQSLPQSSKALQPKAVIASNMPLPITSAASARDQFGGQKSPLPITSPQGGRVPSEGTERGAAKTKGKNSGRKSAGGILPDVTPAAPPRLPTDREIVNSLGIPKAEFDQIVTTLARKMEWLNIS